MAKTEHVLQGGLTALVNWYTIQEYEPVISGLEFLDSRVYASNTEL